MISAVDASERFALVWNLLTFPEMIAMYIYATNSIYGEKNRY